MTMPITMTYTHAVPVTPKTASEPTVKKQIEKSAQRLGTLSIEPFYHAFELGIRLSARCFPVGNKQQNQYEKNRNNHSGGVIPCHAN